jgi:hypothetical protein
MTNARLADAEALGVEKDLVGALTVATRSHWAWR